MVRGYKIRNISEYNKGYELKARTSGIVSKPEESKPEDYNYSSARNYCGETGLIEVEFIE